MNGLKRKDYPIRFRPAKADRFPKRIDMERIQGIGGQIFVKQESEDVVIVMTGGFKPYFVEGHQTAKSIIRGKIAYP